MKSECAVVICFELTFQCDDIRQCIFFKNVSIVFLLIRWLLFRKKPMERKRYLSHTRPFFSTVGLVNKNAAYLSKWIDKTLIELLRKGHRRIRVEVCHPPQFHWKWARMIPDGVLHVCVYFLWKEIEEEKNRAYMYILIISTADKESMKSTIKEFFFEYRMGQIKWASQYFAFFHLQIGIEKKVFLSKDSLSNSLQNVKNFYYFKYSPLFGDMRDKRLVQDTQLSKTIFFRTDFF